jgi:hypothetical protein
MTDTIIKFKKKAAAKKPSTAPKATRKILSAIEFQCPDSKGFWFVNGQFTYKLTEFSNMIASLTPQEFAHHVNDVKNDFANWIGDVFDLKNLAKQVRQAKTQQAIVDVLNSEKA